MIRFFKLLIFTAILLVALYLASCKQHYSQVLVVGTIHQKHRANERYSYRHILQILDTFNPDVICVEIRPEEFRKKLYLKEMVLAAIYGLEHGKKVYPIDWWTEGNSREERKKYMETSEYTEKNKLLENLTEKNTIIQAFKKNYGEWEEFSTAQDYSFFSGQEYNDFKSEAADISLYVYGNHCMNGYWQTRNQNMFARIKKVIEENKGKRIIVLTGADHKYFFDRALENLPELDVVDLSDILPLDSYSADDELNIYYAKGLVNQYFNIAPEKAENTFRPALIPFVHGPNMDFRPEIIPQTNIEAAKVILDAWQKIQPESILLDFELGWYYFLVLDHENALNCFERVVPKMEKIESDFYKGFVREFIYRNMGFCYDLLGEREKAVEFYVFGEQILEKFGKPESYKKAVYRDFKHKPFQWPEKDN